MIHQTTRDDAPLTAQERRRQRMEHLAPWLAGLFLVVPVLVAFYPPMTDLPFHEAGIGLLRHRNNPAIVPPRLYVLNFGQANQLFYLLGWPLSYVVSTRWAAKLVVAAAVMAIPVCAARLARHLGASRIAALLVAPMAVGWLFSWGLIANLLGLAVLLAVLPGLDRFAARPTWPGAVGTLGAVILLYFAHEAMMVVYGGMAILLAVVSPGSLRRAVWRLLPAAFVTLVHLAFRLWVQKFITPTVRAVPVLWHSLVHKIERVPYIVVPATDSVVRLTMFTLCVLTLTMFLWLRAAERRDLALWAAPRAMESRITRVRAFAYAYRWEAFALACFALYFAAPASLSGSTLIYQRFFPPAYAVLASVAAPRDLWTAKGRVARLSALALPAATLLICWPSFVDSSREYSALEDIISFVEPGSALVEIDLGPGDPSRGYSLAQASGRILATRGGRLAYAFTDSAIFPMFLAWRYQWNNSLARFAFDRWSFRPKHDLKLFKYILLRTTDPRLEIMATLALHSESDYVAESGEWVLLKSKLPVVPTTSGELPMDYPPPDTLRDRLQAIVANAPGQALPEIPGLPDIHATNERSF